MGTAATVRRATVADLLAIPEERRHHEVIDGELIEKDAASARHGGAQVRLSRKLGPYDRRAGGRAPGGWWFVTEVEVQLSPEQVFRPDVTGWRREHLPTLPSAVPVVVRPDWICEVLSTNRQNDLIKKKRAYHRHEVPHYWLLDPDQETLTVYRFSPDGYVEILIAGRQERVRAEPFQELEISVATLFGDDDDDGA